MINFLGTRCAGAGEGSHHDDVMTSNVSAGGSAGCDRAGCGQWVTATRPAGPGLLLCSRCRLVAYCSKGCQLAAWKGGHKRECRTLQASGSGRALLAAPLRSLGYAWTPEQERVCNKLTKMFQADNWWGVAELEHTALEVARELRAARPDCAVGIYSTLGESFSQLFELGKAIGLLEQARAIAAETGDQEAQAAVCTSLGNCHMSQGAYEKAIELLEQVRAIAVETGDRETEGVACHNLGRCYSEMRKYEAAMQRLEQALPIKKRLGDLVGQASTRINMGHCLVRQGEYKRAVGCLNKAWAVCEDLGDGL